MLDLNLNNPFHQFSSRFVFLAFFALILIWSIPLTWLSWVLDIPLEDPFCNYLFFGVMFISLCLLMLLRLRVANIQLSYLWGKFPSNYPWLRLVLLTLCLLTFSLGSAFVSYSIAYQIAPQWMEGFLYSILQEAQTPSAFPKLSKGLEILALLVIAPLAEEFIFRGILFHRWSTKWGIKAGILLSSFLFGLGHANPVGLTMVGIILCLLYLQSRSIWIPIITHFLNNGIIVILQTFSQEDPEKILDPILYFTNWKVGLALMAIALPYLIFYSYKNFPHQMDLIPYLANIKREKYL